MIDRILVILEEVETLLVVRTQAKPVLIVYKQVETFLVVLAQVEAFLVVLTQVEAFLVVLTQVEAFLAIRNQLDEQLVSPQEFNLDSQSFKHFLPIELLLWSLIMLQPINKVKVIVDTIAYNILFKKLMKF